MGIEPFKFISDFMTQLFVKLNSVKIIGAPLGNVLFAFIIVSMVITVFWKGARG